MSDRLARQWIAEHGEAYVAEKLDYLKGRAGVESPVRYLTAALRDDYKEAAAQEPSAEAVEAANERAEAALAVDEAAAGRGRLWPNRKGGSVPL